MAMPRFSIIILLIQLFQYYYFQQQQQQQQETTAAAVVEAVMVTNDDKTKRYVHRTSCSLLSQRLITFMTYSDYHTVVAYQHCTGQTFKSDAFSVMDGLDSGFVIIILAAIQTVVNSKSVSCSTVVVVAGNCAICSSTFNCQSSADDRPATTRLLDVQRSSHLYVSCFTQPLDYQSDQHRLASCQTTATQQHQFH